MDRSKLQVKDWMTTDPITVPISATLAKAHDVMVMNGVRRLPVVDDTDSLIGIITRSDIYQIFPFTTDETERTEAEQTLGKMPMDEAMTWEPVTIAPDRTIRAAAELMLEYQISGLPVEEGDKLIGIITETDIFRLVVESWDELDAEVND